jgi:hypothetical protein
MRVIFIGAIFLTTLYAPACVPVLPADCQECSLVALLLTGTAASNATNAAAPRIFVTAATHDGGFDIDAALAGGSAGAVNSDGNGIPEADNFCATDANRPTDSSRPVRALLVDGVNRVASATADAGDGQVDWVLAASQTYLRPDGLTPIFASNANRIFVFGSLTNSMGTNGVRYWTGLSLNWTTSTRHCVNWTSNSVTIDLGERGRDDATNSIAVANGGGSAQCSQSYHLLCVEQ